MPRQLTPKSRLETLKREAKRWLKAIRAGDAAARERLKIADLKAPAPALHDVQHALAREYGLASWAALKAALADLALAGMSRGERVDLVLRHVWNGDPEAAARIIGRYPEIADESLYTAAVCGDLAEVQRRLAADPAAASRKGGPLNWEPLLYLAYARLPLEATAKSALAIAVALLDHGGDPNASFNDGWENPFTVLCGVIGEGEGAKPPHPHAEAFAHLLIERGATPFDTQALYNTSIVGDDVGWLDLLFDQSVRRGGQARWIEVLAKPKLGGRTPLSAVDYLLGNAVSFNHPKRAAWLLEHGADANGLNAYTGRPHHTEAELKGFTELAALLVHHGADAAPLKGRDAFQAACLRLEAETARGMAARRPEYLTNPAPLLLAAGQGRADAVSLILDLGMPVDLAEADGVRALHNATEGGALAVVDLLIARGADVDGVETRYGQSPLGWAVHLGRPRIVERLAPISRDVFALAATGRIQRLREVLAEDPNLANARRAANGQTPLFRLPDDEDLAVEVALAVLAAGADPAAKNGDGDTPAKVAIKRGLDAAADVIQAATRV